MSSRLTRLQQKWDALAAEQLRAELERLTAEVARLAEENERLTRDLYNAEARVSHAEHWAESWRDDFFRACEDNGALPGLTKDGHLVQVLPAHQPPTTHGDQP